MMSTDIVKAEPLAMDVMTMGKMLAQSGYFQDAKEAAQAVVKVLAGQEMGIGPVAAMTGIYIVKGRVTLSANLMAAQIKRSGKYTYRVDQLDDAGCAITFYENTYEGRQEIGRSSFTADDAQRAGLLNSSEPWKKTPRNMFFARAMSNGAKWYCPEIFSGPVYTPDELDDTPVAPSPATTDERSQPVAAALSPIREITTKAPEAVDTTTRLQRDLKALRECERSLGMQVPAFSWNAKRDSTDKLQTAISESRQRIIAAVPGLLEQVGGLLEGATDMETAAQFHRYAQLVDALDVVHDGDLIAMASWLFEQTKAAFEEADVVEPAL